MKSFLAAFTLATVVSATCMAGELPVNSGTFFWSGSGNESTFWGYVSKNGSSVVLHNAHTFALVAGVAKANSLIVVDRSLRRTDKVFVVRSFERDLRFIEVASKFVPGDYDYLTAKVLDSKTVEFSFKTKDGAKETETVSVEERMRKFDPKFGKAIGLSTTKLSLD